MKQFLVNGMIAAALAGLLWRVLDRESFSSFFSLDKAGDNPSLLLLLGILFSVFSYVSWRGLSANKGIGAFDAYFKVIFNAAFALVCLFVYFFMSP